MSGAEQETAPVTIAKPAPPPSPEPVSHHGSGRGRYILTELFIVTVGVLIALSVDGFRQWYDHRSLAEEARRNIAQEIRDNSGRLNSVLDEIDTRRKQIDDVLTLADDLLAKRPLSIHQIEVGSSVAEISDANWKSAERTGALGYMEYAEVQRDSELYELQALFAEQQRRRIERIALALATVRDDPEKASVRDLESLRDRALALRGDLLVIEQLGHQLKERYAKVLTPSTTAPPMGSAPPAR